MDFVTIKMGRRPERLYSAKISSGGGRMRFLRQRGSPLKAPN
jgi:hypothetical protein